MKFAHLNAGCQEWKGKSRAEQRNAEKRCRDEGETVAPIHPLTATRVRMGIVAIRAESLSMPERRSNRQVAKKKKAHTSHTHMQQFHLCLTQASRP
jgi:hypothetical protein